MSNLIKKAAIFAKKAHATQVRKYTGEPYFVHCEEVAFLVKNLGNGTDEMVAAAYLHDTVEDCGVSFKTIEKEFGNTVCELVEWLTDVSRPEDGNREERKAIDRAHIANASNQAKTIKLADLISNSKSITERDPDFAIVYMKEKEKLMFHLKDGNQELYKIAEGILNEFNS